MRKGVAPPGRSSSDRRRTNWRRRSTVTRTFVVLMAIGCLALAVAVVASVVSGGYRPERYGGGFDPVRAAALLSFGAMAAGFALAAAIAVRTFWSEREVFQMAGLAIFSGLTVLGLAGFLFFATVPDPSPALIPRSSIQVLAYLGLGLVAAGFVPLALEGAAGAVKRRDPNILIVLIALALIVVIRLVSPD